VRLEYVGSAGTIDLTQFETAIYKANFHAYEWGYAGTEKALGVEIDQFTRDPLAYEMTIAVRGNEANKKKTLNNILEITERDVINMTPGKLYWNEHYLECYVIASETYPSEDFHGAERTMTVLAPYPFWIKENVKQFYKKESQQGSSDLDFPYDYSHDFAPSLTGQTTWKTDHYAPSEFEMMIYGPCINPRVLIEGHGYQVYGEYQSTDVIIINSRKGTIIKCMQGGSEQNIFDMRKKDESVFEKIPAGTIAVTWSGDFGFELKLFQERSEPAW